MPLKILAKTSDITSSYLSDIYNNSVMNNTFPDQLKLADVIQVHKKKKKTLMENYRPISILPTISKIF